jgi:hypothetical protein
MQEKRVKWADQTNVFGRCLDTQLLAYTTHVAFSSSKSFRCALVMVAGSTSDSRPPRFCLGLVIVVASYLGCGDVVLHVLVTVGGNDAPVD